MRRFLLPLAIIWAAVVLLWLMHHFLGQPPCQHDPLFTLHGTVLDCEVQ